jgi:hypothetical protein
VPKFISSWVVSGGLSALVMIMRIECFTFQVQDNGGTASGGIDLDASPNTLTIDVAAVNDAPTGANNTITTPEDTLYTFAAADFGFSDAADAPANNLLAVKTSWRYRCYWKDRDGAPCRSNPQFS